ncbi:MAG: CBS domain-containing protein [Candidatus Omnitrophota bacterium]|jgi:CBS domain-containing protein
MLIREIMAKNVITVSPDTSLREAGKILKEKRISGIPVIERDGRLVGVITITDILKIIKEIYQWQQIEKSSTGLKISDLIETQSLNKKVGDVMTKSVFTLEAGRDVNELMRLVFTKNIHTIPITENGSLVGVVGKHDLVGSCF